MADRLRLEFALDDIQADARVLQLVNEADEKECGFARYGLPYEDGFDLKRVRLCDALAASMALQRLQARLADAIAAFQAA